MASSGQRYVETIDAITAGAGGALADGYQTGQIVVDLTDGKVYVAFGDAWVLIGGQAAV
jgi:hypothetical protein